MWSVLNPYLFNTENALTDPEREYLKNMLFQIKKYELNIKDSTFTNNTASEGVIYTNNTYNNIDNVIIKNNTETKHVYLLLLRIF